jgi:hypothetical protein
MEGASAQGFPVPRMYRLKPSTAWLHRPFFKTKRVDGCEEHVGNGAEDGASMAVRSDAHSHLRETAMRGSSSGNRFGFREGMARFQTTGAYRDLSAPFRGNISLRPWLRTNG